MDVEVAHHHSTSGVILCGPLYKVADIRTLITTGIGPRVGYSQTNTEDACHQHTLRGGLLVRVMRILENFPTHFFQGVLT